MSLEIVSPIWVSHTLPALGCWSISRKSPHSSAWAAHGQPQRVSFPNSPSTLLVLWGSLLSQPTTPLDSTRPLSPKRKGLGLQFQPCVSVIPASTLEGSSCINWGIIKDLPPKPTVRSQQDRHINSPEAHNLWAMPATVLVFQILFLSPHKTSVSSSVN